MKRSFFSYNNDSSGTILRGIDIKNIIHIIIMIYIKPPPHPKILKIFITNKWNIYVWIYMYIVNRYLYYFFLSLLHYKYLCMFGFWDQSRINFHLVKFAAEVTFSNCATLQRLFNSWSLLQSAKVLNECYSIF